MLETESNSLSERTTGNTSPTTASVVMSRFRKLKQAHAETCNCERYTGQLRKEANSKQISNMTLGCIQPCTLIKVM